MEKKNLIIISIVIALVALTSGGAWVINNLELVEIVSPDEEKLIEELTINYTDKKISTDQMEVELLSAMYNDKTRIGYCVFFIKSNDDHELNVFENSIGNIECGSKVYSLRFAGSGSAREKVIKEKDGFYFYYSFTASSYMEGYEHSILLLNDPNQDDVIGAIDLSNQVSKYDLEISLNDNSDMCITPLGIWYENEKIKDMSLVYDDGSVTKIMSKGLFYGGGANSGSDIYGIIIKLERVCDTSKLKEIIIDGEKIDINKNLTKLLFKCNIKYINVLKGK